MNMQLILEGLWILTVVFLLPIGIIALYFYLWCIRILPVFRETASLSAERGYFSQKPSSYFILQLCPYYLLIALFLMALILILYLSGHTLHIQDAIFLLILLPLMEFDKDYYLLPDPLIYPLLWGGIFMSLIGVGMISLVSAISGIVIGYLLMSIFYYGGRIYYRREVLGRGDLKLVAALGAWLGSDHILLLLFLSAMIALIGVLLRYCVLGRISLLSSGAMIPFGPALGIAGILIYFSMLIS